MFFQDSTAENLINIVSEERRLIVAFAIGPTLLRSESELTNKSSDFPAAILN